MISIVPSLSKSAKTGGPITGSGRGTETRMLPFTSMRFISAHPIALKIVYLLFILLLENKKSKQKKLKETCFRALFGVKASKLGVKLFSAKSIIV